MQTVNLREVRNHLPIGSIVKIAEKLNLSPAAVSQVFRGRYPSYKNAVLRVALEIIRAKLESEKDVTEEAEKLGLTTGEFTVPYKHKKKVPEYKPTYSQLYGMSKEGVEVYLKNRRSQIQYEDYAGILTSNQTAFVRYIDAIAEEQGIEKPTFNDIKKMDKFGLMRCIKQLGIIQNQNHEEELKNLPDEDLRYIIDELIRPSHED